MKNKIYILIGLFIGIALQSAGAPCNFTVTIEKQDVDCYGNATGYAKAIVTGNTGPYTFHWSNGKTTQTIDNLPAETYFVKVTDSKGCEIIEFVQITQPEKIVMTSETDHVKCYSEKTGSIEVEVTGGTGEYSYLWSNGAEEAVNDPLYAGTYYLTVQDANFCSLRDTFTITQPEPLSETHVVRHVRGYGLSDGAIDISVDGGTKPYEYRWDTTGILVDSTEDIYDIPANDYMVHITDKQDCKMESTITVNQPPPLKATMEVTDVNCKLGTDGSIDLTVTGGVPPYSYVWANSEKILKKTTQDVKGLKKERYSVTITDSKDITLEKDTVVKEPTSIKANIEPFDAMCYDSADGYALLTVSGGIEPYSYLWSNASKKQDLKNVKAGSYSVLILDKNGCSLKANTQINQPEEIIIDESVTHVTCKDQSDGEAELSVSGGIPPYSYNWSNGETTKDVEDLPGGDYTVTVRDDHNCPMQKTMNINVPEILCIKIPSAFTPNGDNINDKWEIRNYFLYPGITVKVFNRRGLMIFSSKGYEKSWDGKYNGNDVPSGTYYYIVNPNNGDKPFTGTVTIVR
jgi:gliding motility-associated-like protein